MINYKLAKKLKDAGFSQGDYVGNHFYTFNSQALGKVKIVGVGIDDVNEKDIKIQDIKIPDLSELMKACGDKEIFNLHYFPNARGNKWEAKQSNPKFQRTLNPIDEYFIANGKTSEEAIAKLWLRLNKSNKDLKK